MKTPNTLIGRMNERQRKLLAEELMMARIQKGNILPNEQSNGYI